MLEYIILGFLMQNEMSGYDLKQWMTTCTSYFFDASFGSIYPALKRMEDKRYIVYRETVEGSKYKKLYSITETGRNYFLDWLEEPINFTKSNHSYLVNIYFYNLLPMEKAVANLKKFIEVLEQHLNKMNDLKIRAKEVYNKENDFRYSTVICGNYYFQSIIDWCNDLIKQLE